MLDAIIQNKQREIEVSKQRFPEQVLKLRASYKAPRIPLSLKTTGIISEFKRKSPSKGHFAKEHSLIDTIHAYQSAGAQALSILTDQQYFGGSLEDLLEARSSCNLPLLRKDFIIDPYQITEARAYGADIILLIARCLSQEQLVALCHKAKEQGLQVLLEVHSAEEFQRARACNPDFIGVNCRDLDTGKTDISFFDQFEATPEITLIAESGLRTSQELVDLEAQGYRGFLIGSTFLESENPKETCLSFISALNKKSTTQKLKKPLVKVCGMTQREQMELLSDVADYLGLIFYESSPRCFLNASKADQESLATESPISKKLCGVFVNQRAEYITACVKQYHLSAVQLVGSIETRDIEILKKRFPFLTLFRTLSILDTKEISLLEKLPVDYLLFDTSSPTQYGGTGICFNWKLLDTYTAKLPFFLSGGISAENISDAIQAIHKHPQGIGIDINSKFEMSPGIKNISLILQSLQENL